MWNATDFEDDIRYSVVVTEVIEYIRGCITSKDSTPVFQLKELKSLVPRRLAEYNASQDNMTGSTALDLKKIFSKSFLIFQRQNMERKSYLHWWMMLGHLMPVL